MTYLILNDNEKDDGLYTVIENDTAQKMKFSITDFFSKCAQIRRKLRIWSNLPKKALMENLFFVQCEVVIKEIPRKQYSKRKKESCS